MTLAKAVLPVAAAAALLAPSFAAPANASTADVTDPSDVLESHFSQFLNRSDDAGAISETKSVARAQSDQSELTIDPAVDEVPSFKVGSDLKKQSGQKDGYTVLTNPEASQAQYVRADAAGATILSTAEEKTAADSLEFDLEDKVKSVARTDSDTPYVFLENGEQVALRSPSVKDASGKTMDASYSIHGDTVKINVDESEADSAAYPLVAASGFEYLNDFGIGNTGPYTAEVAMKEDGQFTKIFPVPGAPDDFPSKGDILPLKMPFDGIGLNFECKMNDEASFGDGEAYEWGFNFLATENHIDGAGSSIQFSIANYDGTKNALYVHGVVKADEPGGISQDIYKLGAGAMWKQFATNLSNLK